MSSATMAAFCFPCGRMTPMRPAVPRLAVQNGVALRVGACALCGGETFRIGGARGKDIESHDEAGRRWGDSA